MGLKRVWMVVVALIILKGCWCTNGCWEQERTALLQLKPFFNNGLFSLQDWVKSDKNSNCCLWEWVNCNATTGRVIVLDLGYTRDYKSREWYLNTSLFLPFEKLEELYLPNNHIAGWVENEGFERLSSRLRNLRTLDLSYNSFNESIFSSLIRFSSLKSLYLANNNFTRSFLNNGVVRLPRLINLEFLDLSYNHFNNSILSFLGGLVSLKSLYIRDNRLNGSIQIKDGKRLSNLKILYLDNIQANKSILLQSLGSFHSLKALHIIEINSDEIYYWTNMEGLFLSYWSLQINFLQSLGALTSFKNLFLRYDELNGTLTAQDLPNFKNLESLDIKVTYMSTSESLDIKGTPLNNNFLQTIGEMNSLEILSLNYSGLSGTLPTQGLCELTRLRELYLDNNDLEGNLPECLANLTSLQRLDLSNNKFTGNIATSPLKSLTSIQFLSLSYNHFQIPISLEPFFNHSKLKYFSGGINEIYTKTKSNLLTPKFQLNTISLLGYGHSGAIPKFLYHQHDLHEVYIYDIHFGGEFPNWLLDNNTELNRLTLVNNSLSGPFHLPIHSHMHLQELYISHNSFCGQIPTDVGAYFPTLVYLYMSMNAFSGSIPSSFGDMNRLEVLDLSNNHLSGQISLNFNLKNLWELYLEGNHFTGRIPDNLSNYSSLEMLDISKNHLSGRIPRWMVNSSLLAITMSNNHLEGPIPSEFCHLDGLEFLDLSENNLSGSLPSCFSLSNFNQVYLSKNRLQGTIPSSFSNNSFLVSLDLSYNHFTGRIPDWIGKVSHLSFLLLNNNHLRGEIPIQLCQSYFLSLINLSHNNLSGSIPPCLNITPVWERKVSYDRNYGKEHVEFTTKTMTYSYEGSILNYMSGIDLSSNNLTGKIPHQIGNLMEIRVLNLSHNSLTGPIPPTFSNLKQVESLDLSYNNLSGKIPPQLSELNFLVIFNVAHNNLSGKTPEMTAQFATFEASSYEGNPFLCGKPLPKSCTANGSPSSMPRASIQNGEGSGFIDMDSFYVTFSVTYITVLLGIAAVLYINPFWRRVWFYMIEMCITSCYYFVVDNLPKRCCH